MVKEIEVINNEKQFKKWFIENYSSLGYTKIIKNDTGEFPDFVMMRAGKNVRVELETLSSHFLLHKHDMAKVDEVVCIKKDMPLEIPIIEIEHLKYKNKIVRISATVEKETIEKLHNLLKKGSYRNKSHVIETAIQILEEKENDKTK